MSKLKSKVLAVKKGVCKSKITAKRFALAKSLNKGKRKVKKKRKESNILLLFH